MSILSELDKTTSKTFVIFLDLLFLIVPGFLIWFYFYPDIFIKLDTIKLVLLSVAIILPFFIVNLICIFALMMSSPRSDKKFDVNDEIVGYTFSIICSNIIIYTIFLLGYFLKLKFKEALIVDIIIEIVIVLVTIIFLLKKSFKKKTSH
jgi:hypothetical protein